MNDKVAKFDLLMRMHFQKVINNAVKKGKFITDDDFSCESCEDFLTGQCPGEGRKGRFVAECIMGKLDRSVIEIGSLNENKN